MSSRGLSRGRRKVGSGRVCCYGCGIGHEGRLDSRLYDGVDFHDRR